MASGWRPRVSWPPRRSGQDSRRPCRARGDRGGPSSVPRRARFGRRGARGRALGPEARGVRRSLLRAAGFARRAAAATRREPSRQHGPRRVHRAAGTPTPAQRQGGSSGPAGAGSPPTASRRRLSGTGGCARIASRNDLGIGSRGRPRRTRRQFLRPRGALPARGAALRRDREGDRAPLAAVGPFPGADCEAARGADSAARRERALVDPRSDPDRRLAPAVLLRARGGRGRPAVPVARAPPRAGSAVLRPAGEVVRRGGRHGDPGSGNGRDATLPRSGSSSLPAPTISAGTPPVAPSPTRWPASWLPAENGWPSSLSSTPGRPDTAT